MKLSCQTRLMPWERDFACSPDEALNLLNRPFVSSCPTTGLNKLRPSLALNFNVQVMNKIRHSEWLLIKDDVHLFDWGIFDKDFRAQQRTQAALKLVASPPAQETKILLEFGVIDSETGEPIARRKCDFCTADATMERQTDTEGLTYLSLKSAPSRVTVKLKT